MSIQEPSDCLTGATLLDFQQYWRFSITIEHLFERRNGLSGPRVETLEPVKAHCTDRPGAVGGPINRRVVEYHGDTVRGQAHVHFQRIGTADKGLVERKLRVFRVLPGRAAVGDEPAVPRDLRVSLRIPGSAGARDQPKSPRRDAEQ